MKISVVAVGRLKEKYFADAQAEYLKRISAYAEGRVQEVAPAPPSKSPAEQSAIETAALLAKAGGLVVALDKSGRNMTSEELASFIASKCAGGVSEFSFLVGGSHGIEPSSLKKVDAVISFGKMTFPHQLFRVMLLEQLYRALSINAGAPYHK